MVGDGIRNEPGAKSIHVPVTVIALLMGIEALRDNQVKMVFCPGHRDIEQTTLLFYFGSAFRRQIRWYAPYLERLYEDGKTREVDLIQLAQIASTYSNRDGFSPT